MVMFINFFTTPVQPPCHVGDFMFKAAKIPQISLRFPSEYPGEHFIPDPLFTTGKNPQYATGIVKSRQTQHQTLSL